MRFSILIALPVCALISSALVIPSTESSSDAIAGSIALPDVTDPANASLSALESEYEKLEVLKHQIWQLHHKVLEQEHEILAIINKDFHTCSGLKCYLQTALKKAPDFYELLKTHFRHHPKNSTTTSWDCPWSITSEEPLRSNSIETVSSASEPSPSHDEWFCFGTGCETQPLPFPPPPVKDEPFHFGEDKDHSLDDGSFRFGGPVDDDHQPQPGWHPDHHGPPTPHEPDAEYDPWKENSNSPAERPHYHKPSGAHPFHMPHPAPRHKHFRLIVATTACVISLAIFGILFKAARLYLSNPRIRADRAARIEECRTRREYRKAACQHRFRQCLSRFRRRRSSGSGDYEEKRAMLQRGTNENQTENHIVGSDINSLRRAHEIVRQLMRAEEGRVEVRPHNCPRLQQQQTQDSADEPIASSSRSIRSQTTMTTLPPYAPPPRYSQELSRDMEVVDGFRYTPSNSAATGIASSASSFILDDIDLCTESSVVDCRSRISMDTEDAVDAVAGNKGEKGRKGLDFSLASDRFRGRFD